MHYRPIFEFDRDRLILELHQEPAKRHSVRSESRDSRAVAEGDYIDAQRGSGLTHGSLESCPELRTRQ